VNTRSGAGIGSGFAVDGDSFIENQTIESGTFQGTEGSLGSGLGGGFAEDGNSYVRRVLIWKGIFNFTVGSGSGLGSWVRFQPDP
jgi:hypothetical protein